MQQRIRAAMAADQAPMLQGIVEADETFVGGKPRKRNRRDDDMPSPRGRGTKKTPVIGAVERGGQVSARVATDLSARAFSAFCGIRSIRKHAADTDQYRPYTMARKRGYQHAVINHSVAYADGSTHTNTIEGFWSLLKRAWYGSHHHYTRHWMPLFVAEAAWKYNHRKTENAFAAFIRGAVAGRRPRLRRTSCRTCRSGIVEKNGYLRPALQARQAWLRRDLQRRGPPARARSNLCPRNRSALHGRCT